MPYRKSKPWGNVKPPVGSVIDWGDPINGLLVGRWLFNEGGGCLISDCAAENNGVMTAFANPPVGWPAGKYGKSVLFNGSTNYVLFNKNQSFGNSGTIFYLGNTTNATRTFGVVATGTSSIIELVSTGSTIRQTNGTTIFTTPVFTESALIESWVLSWSPAVSTLYRNGVPIGTGSACTTGFTFDFPFAIGARNVRGTAGGFAAIRCEQFAAWNRTLLPSEVWRLLFEPFAGIVAPRRRIISAVSGASTYNVTVTETGTGLDTVTVVAVFASSTAEVGTASDTPTCTATFAGSCSETGAASDTATCAAVFASSVAEVLTCLDTVSNGSTYGVSCTEAGSATDTVACAALFASATSDTLTAADTVSAAAVFASAISDTLATSDTATCAAVFTATCAETSTATDTLVCIATFTTTCVEAGTALDTCSTASASTIKLGGSWTEATRTRTWSDTTRGRTWTT